MLRKLFVLMLLVLVSAGCALLPPKRIPVDRLNYLEAINTSWKEQLLKNLVMLREGDSAFLELTGVTTGYTLGGQAQAGYSSNMSFSAKQEGNDFLWSPSTGTIGPSGLASINYSRTPSISYTPIRGEYLRKIVMDPILLDNVLKIMQVNSFARYILPLTVESITVDLKKRYRNNSDEFYKFVSLFNKLFNQGIIKIHSEMVKENVEEKDDEIKVSYKKTTTKTVTSESTNNYLIINDNLPLLTEQQKDLKQFRNLLFDKNKNKCQISIQTRSIMQLLVLLCKPEGLSIKEYDSKGLSDNKVIFIIKSIRVKPDHSYVTIKYGDLWYYIDYNEYDYKNIFSLTVSILAMSESGGK